MLQLSWLVNEYLAITEFLLKSHTPRKGFLAVDKRELERLLNKNQYETAHNKLMYWKQLHWIDTEADRVTKRVYDGSLKKQVHMVKIDVGLFQTMKKLAI